MSEPVKYNPLTGTRLHLFWQPLESSTVLQQIAAVEMPNFVQGQSAIQAQLPPNTVITESDTAIVLTIPKGTYAVSDPKPQPPKPKADDFVQNYRTLYSAIFIKGNWAEFPNFIALTEQIRAAGLTVEQVAAAAGVGGK